MIHSTIVTGTHLFTSILVSETGGTIIIMDGMEGAITAIGTITGLHIIRIMIVMAIITGRVGIRPMVILRDGIQAVIPNLYQAIIYHGETGHQSIHRVTPSIITI